MATRNAILENKQVENNRALFFIKMQLLILSIEICQNQLLRTCLGKGMLLSVFMGFVSLDTE